MLLQVAFHSRIAQEHPTDPFSLDEVAKGVARKLIGRHPHVFADEKAKADVTTAADVEANWDRIKAAEKGRSSAVEGVPIAMPALMLADKLLKRAATHDVPVSPDAPGVAEIAELYKNATDTAGVGDLLLSVTAHARSAGVDPEEALRGAARRLRDRIVAYEGSRDPGGAR